MSRGLCLSDLRWAGLVVKYIRQTWCFFFKFDGSKIEKFCLRKIKYFEGLTNTRGVTQYLNIANVLFISGLENLLQAFGLPS